MKRLIDKHLEEWKNKTNRKSLIIRGARQVGKTFSVRKFAETFDSYVEINFERSPEYQSLFKKNLDPKRIVHELTLISGKKILPGKTLLFLDEIQTAERAILALRYFYEEMPDLHVVAAGSLLEFQIEKVGVPVGRVEFLYMRPMSFLEFLWAKEEELLANELVEKLPEEPVNPALHDKLVNYIGEYLAVGGMPEALREWIISKDMDDCLQAHHTIIESYTQDFEKYAKKHQIKYVEKIFNETPLLSGKKFKFSNVSGDFRSRELKPAMELLIKANIITPVYHTSGNGVPLGAEADLNKFKLLFLDVGLAQTILGNNTAPWIYDTYTCFINKGEIVESFIGQEFLCYNHPMWRNHLHYWHRESPSSNAEVDYVINIGREVIPVEVKSGGIGKSKSLAMFMEAHPESKRAIHLSPENYSRKNWLRCYPLYSAYSILNTGLI